MPLQKKLIEVADGGEPDDVGKVVLSLVKGDFMYSTEQVMMVDGGLRIPRL